MLKVHGKHVTERQLPCDQCDKVFHQHFLLKNHVKSVHEKKFRFNCETCSIGFTVNQSYQKHLRRVHLDSAMEILKEMLDPNIAGELENL